MLFVRHFKSIIHQCVEIIFSNLFITDVYPCSKLREINIDPPRIFRFAFEKSRVFDDIGVGRVFKCVRVTGLIKLPVGSFREIYFEISSFFSQGVITVAAY